MARPPRIDYDDAWHHVMNRGRNHQVIFRTDADRRCFLSALSEATQRFEIRIHAFALMPNHYHLLIHTPKGHLSEAMQLIGGSYTQNVNRVHDSDGALFKGRFRSIHIDDQRYLVEVVRYIHNNPVKAGLAPRAVDFRWSSHRSIIGLRRPPDFLNATQIVQDYFGGDRARFAAFVEERTSAPARLLDHLVDRAPDTARLSELLATVDGLPDDPAAPVEFISACTTIERYVATTCDVPPALLRQRTTGHRNDAVALYMLLLHRRGVASLDQIAAEFGYRSRSGVATAIARLEGRSELEPDVRAAIRGGVTLPLAADRQLPRP